MARLSFMRVFPDGTPTHFMEKVSLCSLMEHQKEAVSDYELMNYEQKKALAVIALDIMNSPEKFIFGDAPDFNVTPKITTIRKSAHLQKYVGKEVECFYWEGKPRRSKHQVWGTVRIHGFQEFSINRMNSFSLITIDNNIQTAETTQDMFKNDGITPAQAFKHFGTEFNGFIYHFTEFRY